MTTGLTIFSKSGPSHQKQHQAEAIWLDSNAVVEFFCGNWVIFLLSTSSLLKCEVRSSTLRNNYF